MQLLRQKHMESCSARVSQLLHPFKSHFTEMYPEKDSVTELSILNTFKFGALKKSVMPLRGFIWVLLALFVYLNLMTLCWSGWILCCGSDPVSFYILRLKLFTSCEYFKSINKLYSFMKCPSAMQRDRDMWLLPTFDHFAGVAVKEIPS